MSDESDTMVALAIIAAILGFLLVFFGMRDAFGEVVACYAGEVNRNVAHWEDDAARILGCGDCECWED